MIMVKVDKVDNYKADGPFRSQFPQLQGVIIMISSFEMTNHF